MKRILPVVLALLPSLALSQSVPSFTNDDYQKALRAESRVLFYSFSPSMPLSLDGLKEVRRAAAALHATLIPLADPAAKERDLLSLGDPGIRYQKSSRLRDLGIQLHYPALLVSDNHKIAGPPIAGFKTHEGYVTLVSELLKLPWKEEFQETGRLALPREMSAFFKPVYGTDFIVSGSARPNYLFNLTTGAIFDFSNRDWGDPGPSPDGEFVTLLSGSGLAWFSTADILSRTPRLLLKDPGLRTYQSVGQLSSSTYRVLGALSSSTNPAGIIVRDYERKVRDDGGKTIAAGTEWRVICEGKKIAIPMMSKTGLLLAGMHEGTLRVFRIGEHAAQCEEVFDSKLVSGKADFSRDDRFLIYVARSKNPSDGATVDTIFLEDLRGGTRTPIYYGDSNAQLAFPGFMSPDRVVAYNIASRKLLIIDRHRTITR